MRAVLLRHHGDRGVLNLEEVTDPEPGAGEVRIGIHACGLNWLDVGVRIGPKFGAIPLPIITGSDIAGTVDALGPGVVDWKVGDRVIVYPLIVCGTCARCQRGEPTTCPEHRIIGEHIDGGLAEYVTVPAANLLPMPTNLTFVEAAAIPVVFMTAWQMLIRIGGLEAGETVLIHGAGGGVASAGIQIAGLAGATVFTTTSSQAKATAARELGAAGVFDYRDQGWEAELIEATGGRGVDLVQDNVGAATWPASLRLLARNGRMVVCGSHSGATVPIEIGQIYHRQLSIHGSNGGTIADLKSALAQIELGTLHPVIDRVLPLEEIAEGHRILEEKEHFGKVVMQVRE